MTTTAAPAQFVWLQANLPWSIPYTMRFDDAALMVPHLPMQHATMHVLKSMGRLCAMFEASDHGAGPDQAKVDDVPNLVADLVVCALRMANESPWGRFNLWEAVLDRIGSRNGVDIRAALAGAPR